MTPHQARPDVVFAPGVLALHGFFEPPGVETACRHFGAALAKGNAGARFRVSQCLEKDDPERAASIPAAESIARVRAVIE